MFMDWNAPYQDVDSGDSTPIKASGLVRGGQLFCPLW